MTYKYLIIFPIPEPQRPPIEQFMKKVARRTEIQPPYKKMLPHVTFHRPIENIAEQKIIDLTRSISLQVHATRITVSDLFNFGKEYAVLPVHATRRLAELWIGITKLLSSLPEYEHGEFDDDNTLHITVAEKLSPIFDAVWPIIRKYKFDALTIPVATIELHRKPVIGGIWEKIEEFPLRP